MLDALYALAALAAPVVALWVVVNIPLWVLLYLAAEAWLRQRTGSELQGG